MSQPACNTTDTAFIDPTTFPKPPKGRFIWITLEMYAAIMGRTSPSDLRYYKLMFRENLDRAHGARRFHSQDIDKKRGSYRVKYSEDPIVDGQMLPRIIPRD